MVPECFDRYDFDYIGLESFEFRGPRSGVRIGHARWSLRDLFSYVSWYKGRRPLHLPQPQKPGWGRIAGQPLGTPKFACLTLISRLRDFALSEMGTAWIRPNFLFADKHAIAEYFASERASADIQHRAQHSSSRNRSGPRLRRSRAYRPVSNGPSAA